MITKAEDLDLVSSRLDEIYKIVKKDRKFFSYMGENSKNYLDLFKLTATSFLLENAQCIRFNMISKALSRDNKLGKKTKTLDEDLDFLRKKLKLECEEAKHSTNMKLLYRRANTAFQGFENSLIVPSIKSSNVLRTLLHLSSIREIFSQIEETDTTEKNIDTIQDEVVNFLKAHKNEIDSNVLLELANIVNQIIAPFYCDLKEKEKNLRKEPYLSDDMAAAIKYLNMVDSYFRKIALLSNKLESAAKQRTTSNWE